MLIFNNTYYTITSSFLLGYPENVEDGIDDEINLNILISDEHSISSLLFKKISGLKNRFIISLSADLINEATNLHQLLNRLYLLKSLDPCQSLPGVTTPVFLGKTGYVSNSNMDKMVTYFESQGVKNIKFPVCDFSNHEKNLQKTEDCCFFSYSSIVEETSESVDNTLPNEQLLSSDFIICFEHGFIDYSNFKERIEQVKATIANYNDSPFGGRFKEKKPNGINFEAESILWKGRALLYQNFLTLSKDVQEKEYYDIIDWYNHEYEILPLWYKQLGHIIKVIMGKRSFRSLFSDNVKKYKD